jgi:hypothetical protein
MSRKRQISLYTQKNFCTWRRMRAHIDAFGSLRGGRRGNHRRDLARAMITAPSNRFGASPKTCGRKAIERNAMRARLSRKLLEMQGIGADFVDARDVCVRRFPAVCLQRKTESSSGGTARSARLSAGFSTGRAWAPEHCARRFE